MAKGNIMAILFGGSGLLLGIVLGALIVGGIGYIGSGGSNIPFDPTHQTIANAFTARDTVYGKELSLKFLYITVFTAQQNMIALDGLNITKGKSYTQSVWAFTLGNDIEAFLTVYTQSGVGYAMVCLVKEGSNAMSISGPLSASWSTGEAGRLVGQIDIS